MEGMSLKQGKRCNAVTVSVILRQDGSIAEFNIENSVIKHTYMLTYESATELLHLNLEEESELKLLSEVPSLRLQWRREQVRMKAVCVLESIIRKKDDEHFTIVGNKADMDESKRAVPTSRGQALADEYGIKFFETSAKTNFNVENVFFSIARDIKQKLAETDSKAEPQTIKISKPDPSKGSTSAPEKSACCGS